MATIPRQDDVLFGKGTAINTHRGNVQLRSMVELRKPLFLKTKRAEKKGIARHIVTEILRLGGRFLMEDPSTINKNGKGKGSGPTSNSNKALAGCTMGVARWAAGGPGLDSEEATDLFILQKSWVVVDDERAVEKVMHRLREKIKIGGSGGQKQLLAAGQEKFEPPPSASLETSTAASASKEPSAAAAARQDRASPKMNEKLAPPQAKSTPLIISAASAKRKLGDVQVQAFSLNNSAHGVDDTNLQSYAPKKRDPEANDFAARADKASHDNMKPASCAPKKRDVRSNVSSQESQTGRLESRTQQPFIDNSVIARESQSGRLGSRTQPFSDNSVVAQDRDRAPALPINPQPRFQTLHNAIPSAAVASSARAQAQSQSQVPTPINIHGWVKAALAMAPSPNHYLEDAVNLSFLLTEELIKLIAATEITLADIAKEKVIIFLEPSSLQSPSPGKRLTIHSVQFTRGVLPLMPSSQRHHMATGPISPKAVCGALGEILSEIFSRGQSSSILDPLTKMMAGDPSGGNHAHAMLPAQKRLALMKMSGVDPAKLGLFEMPVSVRQLVGDLLDAADESRPPSDSGLASLEEVKWDLVRMRDDPKHFLFDRTCPLRALQDTCLFQGVDRRLFGREKELSTLMAAKNSVGDHVMRLRNEAGRFGAGRGSENGSRSLESFQRNINFYWEAAFLSGYAGSGKSCLLHSLIHACTADGWFVLSYKFDKQVTPIKTLTKALDDFFAKWASVGKDSAKAPSNFDLEMRKSFRRVCRSIACTIDEEGLIQLCEIIPSLGKIFPQVATAICGRDRHQTSMTLIGSAAKRRMHMFHVILKAICSSGRPVLIAQDDLQWNDSMEGMKDFILNYGDVPCATEKDGEKSFSHGLMYVGALRSNEIGEDDDIVETVHAMEQSENTRVAKLDIRELGQNDIGKFLSDTLCLPLRHVRELARLVHTKTRGNPFFVNQFLKTIIHNQMMQFSVKSRRWEWECDVIDTQMISDGVAELLATRFNELPLPLMQTVMITSCFGSQIDESTVNLLNAGHQLLPFEMEDALKLAVKEGIVEKAGPLYQFTHDLIRQTIYETIPANERKLLHQTVGSVLLRSAANDSAVHLLAVDQINTYCQGEVLGPGERSHVARINATAAKYAIAASSFEQARSYVSAGMRLLDTNRWDEEYSLTLQLYEMSASISCFNGETDDMASCLREVIANVRSFEDSLTSSSLLAKLLAASHKYPEAIKNCLSILSALGEEFPEEISLPFVLSELSVIQTTLANISVNQVKLLPEMTDKSKLNAMKFLSMLCSYSIQSKPMLVPILSCRMVRLTIEKGFCDDSIVGLVTAGYSLFSFTDDIKLGYRIGKVGESFIEESRNRHALRSRLCFELDSTLKAVIEPMQPAVAQCPDRYDSAMLAGDVASAMLSLLAHCIGSLHIGVDLVSLSKSFVGCIKQSTKFRQNFVQYLAMSAFGACIFLSGRNTDEVEVKSYEELNQIGERGKHLNLLYQNFFNQMYCCFWAGEYAEVAELSKRHKPTGQKRILEVMRTFFEGVAALTLARHTGQASLKKTGEGALQKMLKWENISKWNFENMAQLLQAELHYLNGDIASAGSAYKASIASACEHKFVHYEALAYELYGIFCVENGMVKEGASQLQMALDKYTQWGAMTKVKALQRFVDTGDPSFLRKFRINN